MVKLELSKFDVMYVLAAIRLSIVEGSKIDPVKCEHVEASQKRLQEVITTIHKQLKTHLNEENKEILTDMFKE